MIDLNKQHPAPWRLEDQDDGFYCIVDANGRYVAGLDRFFGHVGLAVAERIVLEHNAGDVMTRRGWNACKSPCDDNWRVDMNDGGWLMRYADGSLAIEDEPEKMTSPAEWPNPCTALVEADKWYRENMEKT